MTFYEILFPVNVSYGAIGGTGWSTRIVSTDGGYEYRNQMWQQTRGEWHVGHNLRKPSEWAALLAVHRIAEGRTNGFRFQDWTDYTSESAPGVGDRSTTVASDGTNLRLYKVYSITDVFSTTFAQNRIITKPAPASIIIYQGSTNTPRSGYTVDYHTGIVSPVGSVVATDTWAGQFHVPVRFDVDKMELSIDLPSGAGWRGIPIMEIRV